MNDREALLKAVELNPDSPICALIYADWLEENDFLEEARAVRKRTYGVSTDVYDAWDSAASLQSLIQCIPNSIAK